jgi:hypothetical protein
LGPFERDIDTKTTRNAQVSTFQAGPTSSNKGRTWKSRNRLEGLELASVAVLAESKGSTGASRRGQSSLPLTTLASYIAHGGVAFVKGLKAQAQSSNTGL